MPRKCTICSHPLRKEIDQSLLDSHPYQAIANNFKVDRQSVRNHALKHVQPLIKEANEQAQSAVIEAILRCREEVNFPPLEKSKWVQNMIADQLDNLPDTIENVSLRVSLMRELRGWFDMENKLTGSYYTHAEFELLTRAVVRIENVIAFGYTEDPDFVPNIKDFARLAARDFGLNADVIEKEYLKRQDKKKL